MKKTLWLLSWSVMLGCCQTQPQWNQKLLCCTVLKAIDVSMACEDLRDTTQVIAEPIRNSLQNRIESFGKYFPTLDDSFKKLLQEQIVESPMECYKYDNAENKIRFYPVLNTSKNKAVLYLSFRCGLECGVGKIIFMELKKEGWHILHQHEIWNA